MGKRWKYWEYVLDIAAGYMLEKYWICRKLIEKDLLDNYSVQDVIEYLKRIHLMKIGKNHNSQKYQKIKKHKIVLILVTASVLLTIATVASASYTYTEETIMLNMEEVQCTSIYHWTGKDAEDKAMRIDNDYFSKSGPLSKPDRHCQCNELERYMKEEYEKPEKEKGETDDVFIDGIRGNIIAVDCDAKCTGYVEVTKDATITCTTTTKWNLEERLRSYLHQHHPDSKPSSQSQDYWQ